MSRRLNGTSDFLEAAAAVAAAYPFSMSCWFNVTSLVPSQSHMLAVSEASTFRALQIVIRSTGKIRARSSDSGGTAASAETTATVSTSTWNHAVATFNSDTDRTVYLNGGNSVNNTTSITVGPNNFNRTTIGAWANSSTHVEFFPGQIGGVGFWPGILLSAAEVALLYRGILPRNIRPQIKPECVPLGERPVAEIGIRRTIFVPTGSLLAPRAPQLQVPPNELRDVLPVPSAPAGNKSGMFFAAV